MSYSAELKKQIVSTEIKQNCCADAELLAACLVNGGGSFLSADRNYIRRMIALAAKSHKDKKCREARYRVFYRKNKNSRSTWGADISYHKEDIIVPIQKNICCASSYIRGCFLRSGYITPPDKPARVDLSFKNDQALRLCETALNVCGIHFNKTKRNGNEVIYIKSSESVSDFLGRIGAVKGMLDFENGRILKKYKNEVNRITNCDNANLDKTVSAAIRQTMLISEFMKTAAFDTMPEQLKEIARLRIENESLTLKELGALLTPVLGKSGVAHRLKKIEDFASNVR